MNIIKIASHLIYIVINIAITLSPNYAMFGVSPSDNARVILFWRYLTISWVAFARAWYFANWWQCAVLWHKNNTWEKSNFEEIHHVEITWSALNLKSSATRLLVQKQRRSVGPLYEEPFSDLCIPIKRVHLSRKCFRVLRSSCNPRCPIHTENVLWYFRLQPTMLFISTQCN